MIYLMCHAAVLSTLCVVLLHPSIAEKFAPVSSVLASTTMNPLLAVGSMPSDRSASILYETTWMSEGTVLLAMLVTIAIMSICLEAIYGTIKGLPKHIIPFLCMQIYFACITGINMIGRLSDPQEIRKLFTSQMSEKCKQAVEDMDDDHLMLWALAVCIIVMFLKIYFISVVWSCYNYLKNEMLQGAPSRRTDINVDPTKIYDSEMTLPPKYEDIILVPVNQLTTPGGTAPIPPAYTEH